MLKDEIKSAASFFLRDNSSNVPRSSELAGRVDHVALEGESPRASHIPSRPLRPAAADMVARERVAAARDTRVRPGT